MRPRRLGLDSWCAAAACLIELGLGKTRDATSTIPTHTLTNMKQASRRFACIFATFRRHKQSTGDQGLLKMKRRLLQKFAFSAILCAHTKQATRKARLFSPASCRNGTLPPNASEGDISRKTRCAGYMKYFPCSKANVGQPNDCRESNLLPPVFSPT